MITALYAAIAAFFLIYLSARVIGIRRRERISIGHSGDAVLERAVRNHANFIEYTPMMLILLVLAELQGLSNWAAHLFGVLILASRFIHFAGFRSADAPGVLRVLGMVLTFSTLALLGVILIVLYLSEEFSF